MNWRCWVQAGLTPLEALRTSTINRARFLDSMDTIGTIEPGTLADLGLLDATRSRTAGPPKNPSGGRQRTVS
jgi:imidazolonepropionase-like amidohydrolase